MGVDSSNIIINLNNSSLYSPPIKTSNHSLSFEHAPDKPRQHLIKELDTINTQLEFERKWSDLK